MKTATYSQAKEQLKQAVKKTDHENLASDKPEIAIEVIEENIAEDQPMKQAFIAEHLFRKTIEEAIPCGIAAMDTKGRQIYVNRTFCDMLGWDKDELLGASYPFDYWDPKATGKNYGSCAELASCSIRAGGLELPFMCKNGRKFWGWVLASPLYNSDGDPAGHLFSIADISSRKKAEAALKVFSSQFVDAREKERQLISRDLHDSIGGRLAGIKYSIEKIARSLPSGSGQIAVSLDRLLQVVKSSIVEVRRISRNLHPSVLDDLGIKAALRDLIREFEVLYPSIKLHCTMQIVEEQLSNQLKITIYRVCQEALTNIGKHSRADRATLQFVTKDSQVVLTITDNGTGISKDGPLESPGSDGGAGLLNIRERIELAGGQLELISERGKGVRIRAVWPIP